jgi:DNA topoisomerase-3
VTEVGLAFIAAVRRVFPAYGDPVSRAVFEAELAEIGRAGTRDEAIQRAAAFKERTRARLGELIEAIAKSGIVAVDLASVPPTSVAVAKAPTKAMVAFAISLAKRKGLQLPRGLKSNGAVCRAFLDQHAASRSPRHGEPGTANGAAKRPSEAMLRFARSLAQEHGIECPAEVVTDFAACKAFLDEHAPKANGPKHARAARRANRLRSSSADGGSDARTSVKGGRRATGPAPKRD